jgi:hypothetical protein
MLKEEWRMHTRLFGSERFALFPVFVFAVSALLIYGAGFIGFTPAEIAVGAMILSFFLGTNVGTIGFVGKDALKNLLGEVNLLVFSSRTLPVSENRIISDFILKDLIYYSFLLITPLSLGFIFIESLGVGDIVRLWISSTGMFLLGVAISFFSTTLYSKSRKALPVFGVLFLAGCYLSWPAPLDYSPMLFYFTPGLVSFLTGFLPMAVFIAVGVEFFNPHGLDFSRKYTDRYTPLRRALDFDRTGLEAKYLIDLARSSGGIWKVFFSQAALFAFFVVMVDRATYLAPVKETPALFFSVMHALGSVSTYNWLTRFDSMEEYLQLPLSREDVLSAKHRTFFLISVPVGWIFIILSGIYYSPSGLAVGLLAYPLLTAYVLGLTMFLTGMETNELFFDVLRFSAFTIAVSGLMVPVFVVAMFFQRDAVAYPAFLAGSAVAGMVGHVLYSKALEKN